MDTGLCTVVHLHSLSVRANVCGSVVRKARPGQGFAWRYSALSGEASMSEEWSESENTALVAEYFAMLVDDLGGAELQ